MREYYVYILRCKDGSYYTGVTNNYERRSMEHWESADSRGYLSRALKKPIKLVHVEAFQSITDAITREKQIKRWSRSKKEALIKDDLESLIKLAKCHGSTSSP